MREQRLFLPLHHPELQRHLRDPDGRQSLRRLLHHRLSWADHRRVNRDRQLQRGGVQPFLQRWHSEQL